MKIENSARPELNLNVSQDYSEDPNNQSPNRPSRNRPPINY